MDGIHPDLERAAQVARPSYEAALAVLRPGALFGDVVQAMGVPLQAAAGRSIHPLVHSVNPYGLICGFGEGFAGLPGAEHYGPAGRVPTLGAEVELQAGMTFAFEPGCLFGKRFVNLGGTVGTGKKGAIELNEMATRLMRV